MRPERSLRGCGKLWVGAVNLSEQVAMINCIGRDEEGFLVDYCCRPLGHDGFCRTRQFKIVEGRFKTEDKMRMCG